MIGPDLAELWSRRSVSSVLKLRLGSSRLALSVGSGVIKLRGCGSIISRWWKLQVEKGYILMMISIMVLTLTTGILYLVNRELQFLVMMVGGVATGNLVLSHFNHVKLKEILLGQDER